MIQVEFNLQQAFAEFFPSMMGKHLIVYPAAFVPKHEVDPILNFPNIQTVTHDDVFTENCYLGTPVFFPVTFLAGNYQVYRKGKIEKIDVDPFRLPLATMVSFRRRKRSTETPVCAGQGSVTETYSLENWEIDFQGLCLDEPRHPQGADTFLKQERRLLDFAELVDAINVKGDLFTMKGIHALKINDIDFRQNKGKPRVMGYELRCSSIEPIELIIK